MRVQIQEAQICLALGRIQLPPKLHLMQHRPAGLPVPAHFRIGLPIIVIAKYQIISKIRQLLSHSA